MRGPLIAISLFIIVGLIWVSIPDIPHPTRSEIDRPINSIRTLLQSLKAYSLDHQGAGSNGNSPQYPASLFDLTRDNHISSDALQEITRGLPLTYSPRFPIDPDIELLTVYTKHYVVRGYPSGTITHTRKKTEQGAAANP